MIRQDAPQTFVYKEPKTIIPRINTHRHQNVEWFDDGENGLDMMWKWSWPNVKHYLDKRLKGREKSRKISIRIVCVPVEI
jgi:hypothetical protein